MVCIWHYKNVINNNKIIIIPYAEGIGTVNDFCFFHIDDVLIHDSNEEDQLKHVKMIFEEITKAGLKLKLSKCAFFKKPL